MRKKHHTAGHPLLFALTSAIAVSMFGSEPTPLTAPPQDKGLPYTRTAAKLALERIKNCTAVFAGSRYAYVNGASRKLEREAFRRDGKVIAPGVFEGEAAGQKLFSDPRGLVIIGEFEPPADRAALDALITLFDTPEKLADPDIATQYIPSLKRQGKWTDHVKVAPEQLALLNGPETQWPLTPKSAYDLTGFNEKLLGSKVPAPGVYPRLLFSPEDVSMLAARIKENKFGQMALIEMEYLFKKSWWDAASSDGQVFQKLSSGDLTGLEWAESPPGTPPSGIPHQFKGQKPGIFSSHIAYVPECLTTMAFYCLMSGDEAHGRQAAAALANYYKLREPLVDEWNAISDSEFGSSYTRPDGTVVALNGGGGATHWRGMHGIVAHMNLGLALDFAGKWMTAEEKETMRRVIAKATSGKRAYGQDGPARFRDVNWVGWDTPHLLALAAIEGLEGFDREAYESNCETVRSFCEWGVDDAGVVYESNGKTPGSLQFLTLSIVTMARRGENLFGHSHWRKFLTGQVQMTSPTGRVVVNSGTQYSPFSRQYLSYQFADEYKAFFPGERTADYLLGRASDPDLSGDEGMRHWVLRDFSPDAYREKVAKLQRLRLPSPTYPGFVHGVLYDTDVQPTTRAELHLPLDFNAPTHGVFSSYSDATPDATWLCMIVRPNHYLGAGHHHSDAGMIHFSALGVDWITESPFSQNYDGKYHNQVLVDGHSEPENMPGFANGYQAAAKYLGAKTTDDGGFATADLTDSYSYRWLTQPAQNWPDDIKAMGWEMDTSEYIQRMFAGTARSKMRPWWSSYTYCNYIPTCRAPFNPMQYVFRSAGIVRGKHSYGLVVDDLKKDAQPHLYQWAAMLNGGVWKADVPGLVASQIVLAFREPDPKAREHPAKPRPAIVPQPGQPLLLVCSIGGGEAEVETAEGPADRNNKPQFYDRLTIDLRAAEAHFRIALVPFRMGEEIQGALEWRDQKDKAEFTVGADNRTRISISRDGRVLIRGL
ncbi:MAG: hypothetical protein NTW87_05805 [Planctomycetota bacterium]|nr:hypothetical protein [Planctomycetota bacterium]